MANLKKITDCSNNPYNINISWLYYSVLYLPERYIKFLEQIADIHDSSYNLNSVREKVTLSNTLSGQSVAHYI